MNGNINPRMEAELEIQEASRRYAGGALEEAVAHARQAVVLFAFADDHALEDTPARRRQRADACQLYGDYLLEAERYAEAANVYQEAVDGYTLSGIGDAGAQARACARKLLDVLGALRAVPDQRLYLLIARYERRLLQLTLEPDSQTAQAETLMQMARILARRERNGEAVNRYEQAVALFAQVEDPTPDEALACAECHHRLGGLYANALHDDRRAASHYRRAIALYETEEKPVYNRQQSRLLCERALTEIETRLADAESPDETPR